MNQIKLLLPCIGLAFCIVAAVYDIKYRSIPNPVVYTGIILGGLLRLFFSTQLLEHISFLLLILIIGQLLFLGGDVKLLMMGSLYFSLIEFLIVFVISQVVVCICGLMTLAMGKKELRNEKLSIPYAPCFTLSAIGVLIWRYLLL